jgi:hypothetical protein
MWLHDGTSFGLDTNIGRLRYASAEFRLRMPLEYLDIEIIEATIRELNLPSRTEVAVLNEKRNGSLEPLGLFLSRKFPSEMPEPYYSPALDEDHVGNDH